MSFLVSVGFQSEVDLYLPGYWKVPSTHMGSLELMLTFFFSKARVKMKDKFFAFLIPVRDQASST